MPDFPTSLGDFQRRYPDEAACAAWLFTATPERLAKKYVTRLIPLAPALPTFRDERAIGARLQPATDKTLIAPQATAYAFM